MLSTRDVCSLFSALVVGAAVCAAFPFRALFYQPVAKVVPATGFSAAFVTLDAEEEMRALQAAKASWQQDAALARNRIRAPLEELPDESFCVRISLDVLPRTVRDRAVPCPIGPHCPSLAAPAPATIPVEASQPAGAAFSRAELLSLDGAEGLENSQPQ